MLMLLENHRATHHLILRMSRFVELTKVTWWLKSPSLDHWRVHLQVLFQKIRSGEYSMDDYLWDHISSEAKDCVQRLLTVGANLNHFRFRKVTWQHLQVDTTARMTVNEALKHPWITASWCFILFNIFPWFVLPSLSQGARNFHGMHSAKLMEVKRKRFVVCSLLRKCQKSSEIPRRLIRNSSRVSAWFKKSRYLWSIRRMVLILELHDTQLKKGF